jgi:REP element-mobilizing transposase RayT
MGRDDRIIDPESVYHVIPVGSDKGPIVWDGRDCESLLADMAKAAVRYRWEVFAWCVMTTHYHLVVRSSKDGFSSGFQLLNGNHSRRTNRRHGRVAHLFKNRPFAERCESDAHLSAAILYTVRNPLAAGLCEHASQWSYSSYRATVGQAEPPPWLNVDALHELFGGPEEFARLVHDGHLPVSDTSGKTPVGTASPE